MVKANAYLNVTSGKESIELYKELFGAKLISHMPFKKEMGANMGFPEDFDYENSTMHAMIDIGGAIIMLSDNMMNRVGGGNVMIFLDLDSKEQLDKIHEKVKKKKYKILMELSKTFWGAWFMIFEDSNGIAWQLGFGDAEMPTNPP